jgi:multidrug efflux pump
MKISHFCIDRPIFAAVISIIITLAGAVAMVNLPIAQYPDITPPTITVSATYPGASAEVVANNVAAPIEQQVNGADNMLYMYSTTSSTGSMNLTIFFEIGTVPSLAQVDVQNRVNLALPQLPQAVQAQGVSVQKRSSAFMMIIAVYSPDDRFSETYVSNYANLYVLDAIKRVPGANQSSIFGTPDYAMRIWLKPDRMASLGITATDVQQAVTNQNQQFAVGRIGQPPTGRPVEESFTLTTQGRLTDPAQFDNIILRAESGGAALVRLKDVGRAEYGLKDYSTTRTFNGKTASIMAVYQQPGANALEVSKAVRATLAEIKKSFPEGIDYAIAMDTTNFTRASIGEVVQTFFEALVLVVLVVYLFLHSFRVTLIPVLAVPVSIVGTFIGMIALGFSINMLTLFGMVLAIGIVVDDAIVVIENVERNMNEHGLAPVAAAKRAMDEVGGPVIAIVLVLCAVFVPVAFLGGITGQLYKQFAITIAISVVISGIVALTLSPALAALLLKPGHGPKRGFFVWFERWFARLTDGYAAGVALVIKRVAIALLLFAGMLFLTFTLFKRIPTSFLPPEDQGYLLGAIILPDAASLGRTAEVGRKVTDFFAENPAADATVVVSGYSILDSQTKNNAGVFFVGLKDFDERKEPSLQAPAIIAEASKAFAAIKEAIVLPINPPSIPGLGTTGGMEFWLQARGDASIEQFQDILNQYLAKLRQRPELTRITATFNANSQQMLVDVDREKTETLGVPVQNVYNTVQILFGSLYVSQFNKFSRLWQVILQAEPEFRLKPDDLDNLYVRSDAGKMVPLKALVTARYVTGPDIVTRFNNFPAIKVTADVAPGFSTGEGIATMEAVAAEVLPEGYGYAWSGQSFEEKKSGGASFVVFVFGLVMVFLILAAQYEKWSLPAGVLLAVPFAIFGALVAIWLRGQENNIYFQIGLTMLIALAAKNAILIFEFAVLNRDAGKSAYDAALTAARERLRPIVMTSFAFILGCVPLAIATGAAANSRHSIGTGVIGGMLAATVIAVFFIPMFYWLIESIGEKRGSKPVAPLDGFEPPDGGAPKAGPGGGAPATSAPHDKRAGD